MKHRLISPSLDLSINDEFFIALCQCKRHSYVVLGVRHAEGVQLLASLGKTALEDELPTPLALLFGLFSCGLISELDSEDELFYGHPNRLRSKQHSFYYQAFKISYYNYLEFISLADSKVSPYPAYKPSSRVMTCGKIRLTYQDKPLAKTLQQGMPKTAKRLQPEEPFDFMATPSLKNNPNRLSVFNTCRHSATALIESLNLATPSLSNLFCVTPPHKAIFINGKQSRNKPFYIFPPLPPKRQMAPHAKLLYRLYRQLEQIPKLKQDHPQTFTRFETIKALYLTLYGKQNESLEETLQSLLNWRKVHQTELSTLRQRFFFDNYIQRTPKTLSIINKLIESECNTATI